jgi:hypothetical protein
MKALPAPITSNREKKPRGKPFAKGNKANPKGRPGEGESWAGMIKKIGNMTPVEAGKYLLDIRRKLDSLGDKLTLKEIVVLRAYSTLAIEANASLMNVLMERAEGKTPSTLQLPGKGAVITWEQFITGAIGMLAEEQHQDVDVIDAEVKE